MKVLPLIKQFLKFGIVGLSNTFISLAIYYTLVYFGLHYILSNIFAFLISVLNACYWNSKYVFNKEGIHINRLIKTYLSYGFTFLLSTFLLYLMIDVIGISKYIAPLINLCITVPINFLLSKFWVFR